MCSSHFCDKQQPHDWNNKNQGCGRWGVTGLGGSNITLMHTVVASDGVGVKVFMRKFLSISFNKLFMTGPIPANTLASTLEQSE